MKACRSRPFTSPPRRWGGDYYDVIPLGDGRYGIVVADVSGKGVPAAILMSSIRTQVRVLTPRGLSPDNVVAYMNETLFKDTEPAQYATLFYGCIDLNAGSLTYVNAGHIAPVIVSRMGAKRRLETGGVPVGMFSGSPYEQGTEFFGAGDRMVLYTDGVSDVGLASGELFTDDDLEDVVFSHRTAPVDELMRGILDQVYRVHGDQEQPDDITLLVVGSDAA